MGLQFASSWLRRTKWNKMDMGDQLKGHVVAKPQSQGTHQNGLGQEALIP